MDTVHFPDKRLGRGVELVEISAAVVVANTEVGGQLAARHAVLVFRTVKKGLRRNILRATCGFVPVQPGFGHDVELVASIKIRERTERNFEVLYLHRVDGAAVGADLVVQFSAVIIAQPGFATVERNTKRGVTGCARSNSIAARKNFYRVLVAVRTIKLHIARVGRTHGKPILCPGRKNLQRIGVYALHKRLPGGQRNRKIAVALVYRCYISIGSHLAHEHVALVEQGIGIAYAINGIGVDLIVERGNALG